MLVMKQGTTIKFMYSCSLYPIAAEQNHVTPSMDNTNSLWKSLDNDGRSNNAIGNVYIFII